MSAANLILRIILATIIVITLGTIGLFAFALLEPFATAFGSAPDSLGWAEMGLSTLAFAGAGFAGLFLALILWLVYAPIRNDRRQQVR